MSNAFGAIQVSIALFTVTRGKDVSPVTVPQATAVQPLELSVTVTQYCPVLDIDMDGEVSPWLSHL